LQHYVDVINEEDPRSRTHLYPVYNPIPANNIVDRLLVYMETPNFKVPWPDDESSGHVMVVSKRSTHWANSFLSHE
jgi:hypothetical protein